MSYHEHGEDFAGTCYCGFSTERPDCGGLMPEPEREPLTSVPMCDCGAILPEHTPEHERQMRADELDEARWRDEWLAEVER